jgi:hypothetical protein
MSIKKIIHFLKIRRMFIDAIFMGVMDNDQLDRICEQTWEIECLISKSKKK